MDSIIFGDNQFFGINHMSEEAAQARAERFKDDGAIIDVIDAAYACGIHAFTFNAHQRMGRLCHYLRTHADKYPDLRLYPSIPYAYKYANAVNEKGILGAINEFIFAGQTAGKAVQTILRGGKGIISRDMIEVMKLLVDADMRLFRGLNVRVVFLQNTVTDLLLGLGIKSVFTEYARHIRQTYGAEPGFNTMNMPRLVDFLLACGIENPIVCSTVNKIGFAMNPSREAYEQTLADKPFRPMAMAVLASGAIPPSEAIEYVCGLPKIQSIVFGASSRGHIEQTKELIESCWRKHRSMAAASPTKRHFATGKDRDTVITMDSTAILQEQSPCRVERSAGLR